MKTVLFFFGCLYLTLFGINAGASDIVTFGVTPTRGPVAMERRFGSMTKVIDEAIVQEVVFRTRASHEQFLIAFNNREFDIVVIHPFDFFRSKVQDEYLPLVRMAEELQPVFVTIDETVSSLQDLRGKKIAFPRGKGFVHILGQRRLQAAGLRDGDYQTVDRGDFASCLQSLVNASVNACLSLGNTIREFSRTSQMEIRVIAETEAIPHAAFFLHKKLTPQAAALRQHLLALNDTEQGRILLHLLLLDELENFTPADLQALRQHPFYRELQSQAQWQEGR